MQPNKIREQSGWNPARAIARMLAVGACVLATQILAGLVTEASAQGTSTIAVRARGTAGGESITLRVDNSNVATWTLTTSYQTFNASTALSGGLTVAFTNDGGSRDVQVDYVVVNGETRQSENQSYNTGLYANGSCGGGAPENPSGSSSVSRASARTVTGWDWDSWARTAAGSTSSMSTESHFSSI